MTAAALPLSFSFFSAVSVDPLGGFTADIYREGSDERVEHYNSCALGEHAHSTRRAAERCARAMILEAYAD